MITSQGLQKLVLEYLSSSGVKRRRVENQLYDYMYKYISGSINYKVYKFGYKKEMINIIFTKMFQLIDRYDESKGLFFTFFREKICQLQYDFLRSKSYSLGPNRRAYPYFRVMLTNFCTATIHNEYSSLIYYDEYEHSLKEKLDKIKMNERERQILYLCVLKDKTMWEVGEKYNITFSRVSQIIKKLKPTIEKNLDKII